MNPQTNIKTNYQNTESSVMPLTHRFNQNRKWIHCPKCIGGNMYRDVTGEYICLQCGCSYYPDLVTGTQNGRSHRSSRTEVLVNG
jgi:hypothetical protein